MRLNKFIIFVALSCVLAIQLQGCLLVPFVESASKLGATRGDREALLNEAVKNFQTNLYWGSLNPNLKVTDEKIKPKLKDFYNKSTKDRKVVEVKILNTETDDSCSKAQVLVAWKTYKLDVLVIEETKLSQEWEFSFSDGWKLTGFDRTE